MIRAVLNLLKPPGMTSHDAVSFVRRIYGQKRVGHGGTLDPAAAGVLPLYLGNATRLVEYGDQWDKEYRAEIQFGISTDTGDDTGVVIRKETVKDLYPDQIDEALASFSGNYMQMPPMYSALKRNGRKLYELAREGKEVQREPRAVKINRIRLLFHTGDRAGIHVNCSKGTYIRTLCEDVGAKIGLPATMSFLLRTRVGPFGIGEAATLEEIQHNPASALLPPDFAVSHCPAHCFDNQKTQFLLQGKSVALNNPENVKISENALVRLYSTTGVFFGMGRYSLETNSIKPVKIIVDGNEKDDADKKPE